MQGINDTKAVPKLPLVVSNRETRGNDFKLYKGRSNTRFRQNFFSERILNTWNSLPNQIVNSPSVKSFEHKLDRYWANRDFKFNYEADFTLARDAQAINLTETGTTNNEGIQDLDT